MNTQDALLFVRVAESLSFKIAASQLGISRSAASKRIALLEKEFGALLINRNSRSISLTNAGSIVLKQCRAVCDALAHAHQGIHGHGMQPVGAIQIAAPTPLGAVLLPALWTEFVGNYPKVDLSVHLIDCEVDVVGGGFDVVLSISRRLTDSNLRAQKLFTTSQVLVASPEYLRRCGTPSDVTELTRHDCLGLGYANKARTTWRFADGARWIDVQVRYVLTSNNHMALVQAACLDRGLLYAPELFVSREIERGWLKVVLPANTRSIMWDVYALYPHKDVPERVRALIDFIKPRLGAQR